MDHLDIETAHGLVRGTLPADVSIAWEVHARGCEMCARLVAEERSWGRLIKLEKRADDSDGITLERMLPRLEPYIPGRARRQRRRRFALVLGCVTCASVTVVASLTHLLTPSEEQRLARELGVPLALQAAAVVNLEALRALRAEPWLADQYATVAMFEKLLRDAQRERR